MIFGLVIFITIPNSLSEVCLSTLLIVHALKPLKVYIDPGNIGIFLSVNFFRPNF